MNRRTRTLFAVATGAATFAGSALVTRIVTDDDDGRGDVPATELLSGDLDRDLSAAPLLGPVSAGGGEPDYDALSAAAVVDGELVSSPVIAGALVPTDDLADEAGASDGASDGDSAGDSAGDGASSTAADDAGTSDSDEPVVFDPAIGVRTPAAARYDLCAGATPGGELPAGCPVGYAGRLLASRLPPEPQLTAIDGRRMACPESPVTAVTVYSATPMQTLTVEWRRYASSDAWASTAAEGTDASLRTAWEARFEAEEYSLAEFGYLAHCDIAIERDLDSAYELRLLGRDIFGRDVIGTAVLPDATPEGRPPTTVTIGDDGRAQVSAWTVAEGSVAFATYEVQGPADAVCPDSLESGAVPAAEVHVRDGVLPSPGGVFDPAFTRQVVTRVVITPGVRLLLCARVYDTPNPLRPLATDEFLLDGPAVQVPRVVLHDIHFTEPVELGDGEVALMVGGRDDGCGGEWRSDEPVVEGHLTLRPPVEFTCAGLTLPLDGAGSGVLPVTTRRWHEGRWLSNTYTLALPQRDCAEVACGATLYWEQYSIPMPPTTNLICGRPFWDTSPCNPPGDGVAMVNVLYDIVGSGTSGEVHALRSTDRPTVDPTDSRPVVQLLTGSVEPSASWLAVPARLSIVADRTVELESLTLTPVETPVGTDPSCIDLPPTTADGGPATEFTVVVNICAGLMYAVTATVTDGAAGGSRYELIIGSTSVVATSDDLAGRVEFLGGDVPSHGWIYQFGFAVEGTWPNSIGWTPTSLPGQERCRDLDTTVADVRLPSVMMTGSNIDVWTRVNITTAGDGECPLSGRVAPGVIVAAGSLSLDQLFSGEPLVLTTSRDAILQLRVTLTGTWQLGELNVYA